MVRLNLRGLINDLSGTGSSSEKMFRQWASSIQPWMDQVGQSQTAPFRLRIPVILRTMTGFLPDKF